MGWKKNDFLSHHRVLQRLDFCLLLYEKFSFLAKKKKIKKKRKTTNV